MYRLKITLILLSILLSISQLLSYTALAQQPSNIPQILSSNETGLTLSWHLPPYTLNTKQIANQPYSQLELDTLALTTQPGHPQLPFYSTLIGLPPSGTATIKIIAIEQETIYLTHPPLPAPIPQPITPLSGELKNLQTGGTTLLQTDQTIYTHNAFYPTQIVTLTPPEQIRHQRIARLTINPIQVNPVSGKMNVIRHLHLQINFEEPVSSKSNTRPQIGTFANTLATTLLNPQAINWQIEPPNPKRSTSKSQSSNPLTKVIIDEAGIHTLSYTDLLTAGLPIDTLNPQTLQLTYGPTHQKIPILVIGEEDGQFDPTDQLIFYAHPQYSRYTDQDVYFLSYGGQNGLRMNTKSANPTGLAPGTAWLTTQIEQNNYYDSYNQGRDGDHWYWFELRQPDITQTTVLLTLDAPLTTTHQATLTVWLRSFTNPTQNPDHHLTVAINNTQIGESTWDGNQAIELNFSFSTSLLFATDNEIKLILPGLDGVLVEGVWLDAIAITYPTEKGGTKQLTFTGEVGQKMYSLSNWSSSNLAVFDISTPYTPSLLVDYTVTDSGDGYTLAIGDTDATPSTYQVTPFSSIKTPLALQATTILTDPPNGADYIIITHPDFAEATIPLANHRTNQGLRVTTVDINAIYDTYSGGRLDPEAIKSFLEHAYTTWTSPAPLYVLLVGDGHYDFKNNFGYGNPSFIPPYVARVDPWIGETASDNLFVTLSGGDRLPDLLIGRLPVNSVSQAQAVINKIIQYETAPPLGDWNAYHLFVADNPDQAGDFHEESDKAYNKLTPPYIGKRFYYTNAASGTLHIYNERDLLRQHFLARFNQGAAFVNFHGHGSWHQWAVEQLLQWSFDPTLNDTIALNNGYRLPVVLEMTCFTGFFHHPEYPTLDESLLNNPNGGAIAIWGPTGLGVGTGHRSLELGFYNAIINNGESNLGNAILAGKIALYTNGFNQDLLDTFTLFGDPALTINFNIVPFSGITYMPLILK